MIPELFCDFAHRSIWARLEHRDGVALDLFRVNHTGHGGRLPSFPTTLAGIRGVYLPGGRSDAVEDGDDFGDGGAYGLLGVFLAEHGADLRYDGVPNGFGERLVGDLHTKM